MTTLYGLTLRYYIGTALALAGAWALRARVDELMSLAVRASESWGR